METIRRVEGKIRLEMAEHVVKFMQDIKAYELLVTDKTFDTGLEAVEDGVSFKLHRPYIDERYPIKDIREFAWAIGLNVDMHAVYIDLLSIGDVTRTLLNPWMAYRGTFHYAASSIILVHNHPSGDPTPSTSDIEFTKKIIDAGLKLPRPLADHIILGDNCHYSFVDDGGENGYDGLLAVIKREEEGVKKLSSIIKEKDNIITVKNAIIKQEQVENEKLKALLIANNIKMN